MIRLINRGRYDKPTQDEFEHLTSRLASFLSQIFDENGLLITERERTLRGPRAGQPDPTTVARGTLYGVTDESNRIERSNGHAWEPYGMRAPAQILSYTFSTTTTAPPVGSALRFNAGAPYTDVTKLWVPWQDTDNRDLYWGLINVEPGAIAVVQDKNDHTIAVSVLVMEGPIDQGTYVEWSVSYRSATGAPLANAQAVLLAVRA